MSRLQYRKVGKCMLLAVSEWAEPNHTCVSPMDSGVNHILDENPSHYTSRIVPAWETIKGDLQGRNLERWLFTSLNKERTFGSRISFHFICFILFSPFFPLQRSQAVTKFVQSHFPPLDLGTTWSIVRFLWVPQYLQIGLQVIDKQSLPCAQEIEILQQPSGYE